MGRGNDVLNGTYFSSAFDAMDGIESGCHESLFFRVDFPVGFFELGTKAHAVLGGGVGKQFLHGSHALISEGSCFDFRGEDDGGCWGAADDGGMGAFESGDFHPIVECF